MIKRTLSILGATILSAGLSITVQAQEVTLKAVSAFADPVLQTTQFLKFIELVNENGKGVIQIDYLGGGGAVMNPFELGTAIQTGVVDIGNLPGAFYTNILPEADALKMSTISMAELRENGGWEFMNQLHNEKANAYWLARQKDRMPFHLYLTEPIDPAEFPNILDGLTIRTTPIYRPFFASMGATLIQTPPGDVFTALERGTVQGYGWPISSIHDLGWDSVTDVRVDPGFFNAAVEILVNLDTWNTLTDEQKAVLFEARDWLETQGVREDIETMDRDRELQRESGIQVITLGPQYLARAIDTGWAAIIEANPETGPRLRELFR